MIMTPSLPARPPSLADPTALARALPPTWMGMKPLDATESGTRRIAQMEISYAQADYSSADFTRQASLELIDTLHSPMHLNDFYYQKNSADLSRREWWQEGNTEGFIVQDTEDGETRAQVLLQNRYQLKISVSPVIDSNDLRQAISTLLQRPPFRALLGTH